MVYNKRRTLTLLFALVPWPLPASNNTPKKPEGQGGPRPPRHTACFVHGEPMFPHHLSIPRGIQAAALNLQRRGLSTWGWEARGKGGAPPGHSGGTPGSGRGKERCYGYVDGCAVFRTLWGPHSKTSYRFQICPEFRAGQVFDLLVFAEIGGDQHAMPGLGASACTIGRQWRDKCHVCLLKSPPLGHDMVDPAPVLRWIKRFDGNGWTSHFAWEKATFGPLWQSLS